MASKPNVNNTTYVNSGPGVGLSSGSSGSGSASSGSGSSGSALSAIRNAVSNARDNVTSAAQHTARVAAFDSSLYGDMVRDGLGTGSMSASGTLDEYLDMAKEMADYNSNLSQSFAREQMQYQTESNNKAMAWSAAEAQKNRDWQERLSNTAHQREVQDLIAAGLNPILSVNNGAYTGSGATGSGFAGQGAQGHVDTSADGVMGQLISSYINTAMQATVAGLYTDASRYQADLQYASAKLASETSIYNNNNLVTANKAISAMNRDADIQKANISASAQLGAAGSMAAASRYASENALKAASLNAEASKYGSELNKMASDYRAELGLEGTKYSIDNNLKTNPVGYVDSAFSHIADMTNRFFKTSDQKYDSSNWNMLGAE